MINASLWLVRTGYWHIAEYLIRFLEVAEELPRLEGSVCAHRKKENKEAMGCLLALFLRWAVVV
jgi:hypothetical protein